MKTHAHHRLIGYLLLAALSPFHPGCGDDGCSPSTREVVVESYAVTTEDKVEIALTRYFLSGGPLAPKPFLLCPGFSEDHEAFDLIPEDSMARYLAGRGIDTWAIDLRGRGASGVPAGTTPLRGPWSVDDFGYLDLRAAAEFIAGRSPAGQIFLLGFSEGDVAAEALLLEGPQGIICGHVSLAPAIVLGAMAGEPPEQWPPEQFLFNCLHYAEPLLPANVFVPFPDLVAGLYDCFDRLGLVDAILQMGFWNIMWNTENMTKDLVLDVLFNVLGNISSNQLKQFLRGTDYLDRRGICTFEGSALEREAGPFCYQDRLPELTMPALVLAGSKDLCVPEVNARFVFDRLGADDRQFRVFGVSHGDSFDYGHDDLTLGVHAPEDVFPAIAAWVLERQ